MCRRQFRPHKTHSHRHAHNNNNLLELKREEAPPADARGLMTVKLRAPTAASEMLRVRSGKGEVRKERAWSPPSVLRGVGPAARPP